MSKIYIESGKSGQTISSGVTAYVCSGATVTNFKVTSGGILYIQSGCAAKSTIVSSGGALVFVAGCKPGSVNSVLAGGIVSIGSKANVSSVTASNGAIVKLYAMANTTYTVTSNGATLKCSGSTFSDWDMKTSLGVLGLWTDGTANWKSLGSGFDSKWAIVGTGDFNGYGMDCVYMSHDGGNNYYMVDVNGTITHMGASSAAWKVVAIGDFYGDGKEDVIAFNEKYGLVDVWSDGKTTVDVNIGQLNAKDWFVAGAGDYNGDGRDDLLVRQKSTGMLGYYSGADMKSGWKTLGYGVSTAWTVIA